MLFNIVKLDKQSSQFKEKSRSSKEKKLIQFTEHLSSLKNMVLMHYKSGIAPPIGDELELVQNGCSCYFL